MRLSSIKLSGFKSFAETTNFVLPGQLVGVVGPNGCGKSNIIDAVRWVLGESKASALRGESMQDVIFNGTNTRKPASRSSVELVFDNAEHRAGGQWAQYAEISVKRVLTRDGNSSYFINGQAVRRRDVYDVFLGTGLGPRAYAIIGQGTISRIIESKPAELRLFLEEAAGVSKYKERRRETENRLNDTRENLTRVEDITTELNTNLEKLQQQAAVAEKYQQLKDTASTRQHQLWFLKKQQAASDQAAIDTQVQQAATKLEQSMADVRHVEAELETIRQAHYQANDQVNAAQASLYEAAAEVGKLEAESRFVTENRRRTEQQIAHTSEQLIHWQQQLEAAQEQSETTAEQVFEQEEQAAIVAAQLEEHLAQQPALEDALQQAREQANTQRGNVAQVQQQIQVLAAEQCNIDDQRRQHNQRRERLQAERQNTSAPDNNQLTQLQTQAKHGAAQLAQLQQQLHSQQEQAPTFDAQRKAAQEALNRETQKQADLSAQLEALKALQETVRTDGKLTPWLQKHGLEGMPSLWSRLQVEQGWESALEAALRERIAALEVSRLETIGALAADAPPVRLSFYTLPTAATTATGSLKSLIDKVRVHDASLHALLSDWLQGRYTASTLSEALEKRQQLQAGEAIYVASGHAVSRHSIEFYAQDNEQAGMLARAQEIDNLEKAVRAQQLIYEESKAVLVRADNACTQANGELLATRKAVEQQQAQQHKIQVELLQLQQKIEQAHTRSTQIDADLSEIDNMLLDLQERGEIAEGRFETLDAQLAQTQETYAKIEEAVQAAERNLHSSRQQHNTLERQVQEAAFTQRNLQSQHHELQRTIDNAQEQIKRLQQQQTQAQDELQTLQSETIQTGLQDALECKQQREQQLAAQRNVYDDLTNKLRATDERRLELERTLEPVRNRINQLQLKQQAARIAVEQHQQSLTQAQVDEVALQHSIEQENIQLNGLQTEIDRIQREATALGAVNLAAMQELQAARERKTFLDSQSEDLNDAIETLEGAIRKIDAETRELLGATFETVNTHFGQMFPELFGGGQAKLIMTGEEILDAGVQVMAQPPGKKNQTIQLLSGGEKALTAIALVFAIFQLNPAPFCLLDEVDAPLDDSNTERYAKLVTRMSKETQFLFISHNKIAMEMAQQLIGVTMQEQGVSRIVAVDMQAATDMIEA